MSAQGNCIAERTRPGPEPDMPGVEAGGAWGVSRGDYHGVIIHAGGLSCLSGVGYSGEPAWVARMPDVTTALR